jgi:outer membrane protein W
MRRLFSLAGVLTFGAMLVAPSASYAQQSVNFLVGGFFPPDFDSRNHDDVLRNNLSAGVNSLAFDIHDFDGVTVGGEWLFALHDKIEGGLGVGFYSQTVASVYTNLTHANGAEIDQDLKLRIVPFTATVRFLPLGRHDAFTPYIGGGVGVFSFRYEETGEFVDVNGDIFPATFRSTGAAVGPVILGGARFPVGKTDIGGEIRWQHAKGDISEETNFLGTSVDLGGFSYLLSFNVKF